MNMIRFFAVTAVLTMLGGCAQEFPVTQLSAEEQQFESTLKDDKSVDARLALVQLYFMHNRIDEADALLTEIVKAEPGNAQAQAWRGANNCKLADRKGPWLLGLDKLYLVNECLDLINQALDRAPDDFTVQMVQMNTGAEVDMFGSLDAAKDTRGRIEAQLGLHPSSMPLDAQAQFYVTAARIERKVGNPGQASAYLDKAAKLAATDSTRAQIALERAALQK